MTELKDYVSGFDPKQDKIFSRPFSQYRWTQIRGKLGLRDFTFHDLRKTFGSILGQNGVSVLVQRETDIVPLRLRESLAFGKEVFLGMREFWITVLIKCAGRPV